MSDFSAIHTPNWQAPWHQSLLPIAPLVFTAAQQCGSVAQALNAQPCAAGVRFVPQAMLPAGVAYEQFIFDTQQVPTRDNLHDFFNGLMWLHFPRTKRLLNAMQGAELARMGGVHATRGTVRDALTLFDENVALLQAPDVLWQALAAKKWDMVFGTLRHLWSDPTQVRLLLFGHALLEQLAIRPFKGLTAHVWRVLPHACPAAYPHWPDWIAHCDTWLAQTLTPAQLAVKPRPFAHLPVLGVPGWHSANTDPAFYADPQVFRPLRSVHIAP